VARRTLAHRLIDELAVDVVHGHSSHHVQAIELYRGRPILYGCGDFLTDYEGIGGHVEYRGDLALMFFVTLHSDRRCPADVQMVPLRLFRLQLTQAAANDVNWLKETLDRECRKLGTDIQCSADGTLRAYRNESA
jgi:poly-gamma-glutamate synthesis protein (capsule biosynthesis protein)